MLHSFYPSSEAESALTRPPNAESIAEPFAFTKITLCRAHSLKAHENKVKATHSK